MSALLADTPLVLPLTLVKVEPSPSSCWPASSTMPLPV